jgi:hypothetical protein
LYYQNKLKKKKSKFNNVWLWDKTKKKLYIS